MAQAILQQKGKSEPGRATDVEALAYLFTANLSVPIDQDYAEIFTYLTRRALDWQNVTEIPDYLQGFETLDDRKTVLLDELKREIWNAQEHAYHDRLKLKHGAEDGTRTGSDYEQTKLF